MNTDIAKMGSEEPGTLPGPKTGKISLNGGCREFGLG